MHSIFSYGNRTHARTHACVDFLRSFCGGRRHEGSDPLQAELLAVSCSSASHWGIRMMLPLSERCFLRMLHAQARGVIVMCFVACACKNSSKALCEAVALVVRVTVGLLSWRRLSRRSMTRRSEITENHRPSRFSYKLRCTRYYN